MIYDFYGGKIVVVVFFWSDKSKPYHTVTSRFFQLVPLLIFLFKLKKKFLDLKLVPYCSNRRKILKKDT